MCAAGRADPCLTAHGSRRGGRSFLTDTRVIHPIHRAAAVPDPASVIPAHQNIRKLVHSLLILAVQIGIGAVGAVAVAQFYFVKPRGIHSNRHIELIVAGIAGRYIALLVSLGVLVKDLLLILPDIRVNPQHLGKCNEVGVAAAPVGGPGNNEPLSDRIDVYLFAPVKGHRRGKAGKLLFIFRTVSKLALDVLHGRVPPLAEKRRELSCAVLTEIAVLQLSVSQKSNFLPADVAVFFVK